MKFNLPGSFLGAKSKILIVPLNWGLGHATRCVPIIQEFIEKGHEVVMVTDGFPLEFLRQQFPSLRFFELPSYSIRYAKGNSQVLAMMRGLPAILQGIYAEHRWLKKLLADESFDAMISDNRFGLWSKSTHSIYITHQLMIKMPRGLKFLEPLAWLIHRIFILRYDECWIPDVADKENLSGDLSHKYRLPHNAHFVGALSRFSELPKVTPNNEYEVVAVLSGVEPQRAIFEKMLIQKYKNGDDKLLIVQGLPQAEKRESKSGNVTLVSHLPDKELATVLSGCRKIICRSGYSTIMDLNALNCLHKAELVPTPGQTEQEYLAEYHAAK